LLGTFDLSIVFFEPSAICCRNRSEQFFLEGRCTSAKVELLSERLSGQILLTNDVKKRVQIVESFVTQGDLLSIQDIHQLF